MSSQQEELLERVFTSFRECSQKVETCLEFADARHGDTKRELNRIDAIAKAAVENVKFAQLDLQTKDLKKQFEREIDTVHEYIRKSNDKMTETQIKF